MRYLKRGSLHDLIKEQGPLGIQEAGRLLNQIATALTVAHDRQIIHRDIKPGNILLDDEGNAYLGDFGIAKDLKLNQGLTGADDIVGSLDYISPEQARSQPVTVRTDVYSLGVVLYEMLTGAHPWPELSSVERLYKHINDPLPPIDKLDRADVYKVNTIIQKATSKNPEDRYATPLTLATAFQTQVTEMTASSEMMADYLTGRERDVLQGIVEGKRNKEIANDLFIELSTVKYHIRQTYRKLQVRSRAQAIIKAGELNLMGGHQQANAYGSLAIPTSALENVENPYKGLEAFTVADADDFFGREALVNKLVNRLEDTRFLAVIGPSGSGKSSVVKAGLVPAVNRGDIAGSDRWYVIDMLPGSHPVDQLEVALTRVAADQSTNLNAHLTRDARGLLRCADLILPDDGSELVVVIDQFEETFTLIEDEDRCQHFLDLLTAAITDPHSRVRIVVTLRADFFDRPLRYPIFGDLLREHMETILPLSAEELERAIVEPAKRIGIIFEPGLVTTIVSEMTYQAGVLPLLQYALMELFDRREGRQITQDAYNEIGGAVGALAQRAEATYLEMNADGQEAIRQMFLRLVTLGEGVEDTRRRTPRTELLAISDDPDLMDEVIDTFAEYRLLSLDHDDDTRQPTVEVAHEAILREWERLRAWLNESRDDIRQERVVARAADDWNTHKRDKSYLLRGARLEQTEAWQASTNLVLTPVEQEFLKASVSQAKIEQQERKTQRNILRLLVAAVIAVLLMGIGVSTTFGITTQRALNDSERIRLAAQAQNVLNSGASGDLPALLALRSLELGYSPDADAALLQALDRGFPVHELSGHREAVRASYSPDGLYAVSYAFNALGSDDVARVWNAQTGTLIEEYKLGDFETVEISMPNAASSITVTGINTKEGVRLYYWTDFSSGELTRGELAMIVFSSDGQLEVLLGTDDDDYNAYLLNRVTGDQLHVLSGHTNRVTNAIFSSDNMYIATASRDQTIRIWDVATGEQLRVFEGHIGETFAEFSSNNRHLLTYAFRDDTLHTWDLQTGEELLRLEGHTEFITCGSYVLDDQYILTSSNDGTARLWHASTGLEVESYIGHTAGLWCATMSPSGDHILTSGQDNAVRIWNKVNEIEPVTFAQPGSAHGNGTRLLHYSQDRNTILRVASDGFVLGLDTDTGLQISDPLFVGANTSVAMSPDELFYLVGYASGEIALYDVTTRLPTMHTVHSAAISDLIFDATGAYAISASRDNALIMWDVMTGQEVIQFSGNTDGVLSLTLSSDGQQLASGHEGGIVTLWNLKTGQEIRQLTGMEDDVLSVAFSPDGRLLATAGADRIIRLWDVSTSELKAELVGHTNQVMSVVFSPDGTHLLSGSADLTARMWDVETGEVVRFFPSHASQVEFVHFSSNGEHVFTSDFNETYMWHTHIEDVIEIACRRLGERPRDFTLEERTLYSIGDDDPTCDDTMISINDVSKATWTPIPPHATAEPGMAILPLPDAGQCPDYESYAFNFRNNETNFIGMGVPLPHVFVEDGNGQVVRTVNSSESSLNMPLYATGEKPDLVPPFDIGPYEMGSPFGVSLGQWLDASGTGTYTRCNNVATIDLEWHHLIPNGVYTIWCWRESSADGLVEDPCGNSDGTDSIFIPDELGSASLHYELENFLFDDPNTTYGLAVVFHSDGQTYGAYPGDWGINAHNQIGVPIRPAIDQ